MQEAPAAELWQLRWRMAKKDMDRASAVARCLYVNPDLGPVQMVPQPLAARIHVSFNAEHVSFSLLVPGSTLVDGASALPGELLSIKLVNLQAGSCSPCSSCDQSLCKTKQHFLEAQ